MATVRNISSHPVDLTGGLTLAPLGEANADVTTAHEAGLIAAKQLLIVDGTVDPPAPSTKNVPVVAPIPYTDSATQVTLDINAEATDAEVAAAIAAVGGRFRGAYASLTVGSPVKANDIVTNPSGALVSRIADGTIAGTYNPASWTSLSAGSGGSGVETVNTVATSGATQTLPDVTTATIHRITLTANCTITFPTAAAGHSFTVILVQDATGSRTVTWPGSVLWPGATAPVLTTTAAKRDVLSFLCADGTNWIGFFAAQNV